MRSTEQMLCSGHAGLRGHSREGKQTVWIWRIWNLFWSGSCSTVPGVHNKIVLIVILTMNMEGVFSIVTFVIILNSFRNTRTRTEKRRKGLLQFWVHIIIFFSLLGLVRIIYYCTLLRINNSTSNNYFYFFHFSGFWFLSKKVLVYVLDGSPLPEPMEIRLSLTGFVLLRSDPPIIIPQHHNVPLSTRIMSVAASHSQSRCIFLKNKIIFLMLLSKSWNNIPLVEWKDYAWTQILRDCDILFSSPRKSRERNQRFYLVHEIHFKLGDWTHQVKYYFAQPGNTHYHDGVFQLRRMRRNVEEK